MSDSWWAVVAPEAFGGNVLVIESDDVVGVPAAYLDLPTYTLAEVDALEGATPADLRSIHAIKVTMGGVVEPRARPGPAEGGCLKIPAPLPPPTLPPSECPTCGGTLRAGRCIFCGEA